MKLFSEFEVDTLIEDLTAAAEEAIEKAAGEAAKAAALASLDAQAKALAQAQHWRGEYQTAKKAGIKTAVITGAVCLLAGLVIGAGGVLILQGGR